MDTTEIYLYICTINFMYSWLFAILIVHSYWVLKIISS